MHTNRNQVHNIVEFYKIIFFPSNWVISPLTSINFDFHSLEIIPNCTLHHYLTTTLIYIITIHLHHLIIIIPSSYIQLGQNHKHSKSRLFYFYFYFIFTIKCISRHLSILKGDWLDKLCFIWNPLPSMIIHDDI